jgi:hypothetical protein
LKRQLIALAVLSVPALMSGAYWMGGKDSRAELTELRAMQDQFEERTRELEQAHQTQAVLASGERLVRQANEQSRQTIKVLEEQVFKLQQDLAFYKGVLAPASRKEGLRVRSFELQATDTPLLFRYKLLLSRVGEDDKPLKGKVRISVNGTRAGQPATVDLAELSPEWKSTTSFAFKHMQAIPEGGRFAELQLPEDFTPSEVKVQAEIDGQRTPLERTYNWIEE